MKAFFVFGVKCNTVYGPGMSPAQGEKFIATAFGPKERSASEVCKEKGLRHFVCNQNNGAYTTIVASSESVQEVTPGSAPRSIENYLQPKPEWYEAIDKWREALYKNLRTRTANPTWILFIAE
jgi:hypothetical protein